MTRAAALFVVLVAACSGSEPVHQHATLGPIAYDIPEGWHRTDQGSHASMWTPPDNDRKESVVVMRGDLDREIERRGPAAYADLLVTAQRSLPHAHVGTPQPVTTKAGLHGFRVAVEFSPFGADKPRYARVHTILLDGATVVHVIYTALTPDPDPQALQMVLDTTHEEG
jgi:hypothetical protein